MKDIYVTEEDGHGLRSDVAHVWLTYAGTWQIVGSGLNTERQSLADALSLVGKTLDRGEERVITTYIDSSGSAHTFFGSGNQASDNDTYPSVYVSVDEDGKRRVTIYTGGRDDVVIEIDSVELGPVLREAYKKEDA